MSQNENGDDDIFDSKIDWSVLWHAHFATRYINASINHLICGTATYCIADMS